MTQTSASALACPGCGKRYAWREDLAGKSLRCGCGKVFRALDAPGAAPRPQPARKAVPKAAAKPAPPAAPAPDAGPLQLAAPVAPPASPLSEPRSYSLSMGTSGVARALENREDEAEASPFQERYLPIGLLVGGIVVQLVLCLSLIGGVGTALATFALAILVQALLFAPAMFGATVATARLFELALGDLLTLLLKIAGLTLGAAGVADILFMSMMMMADFDIWLVPAGYAIYLVFCGIPAAYLLEMNLYETAFAMALNYLPRIGAVYIIAATAPNLFP